MTASPTSLSLAKLRAEGYTAETVEYYNTFTKRRHDLFGVIDILALKPGETLAVQTTSRANVSSRVNKIAESLHIGAMREAGWTVHVHGWDQPKGPRTAWRCRTVDCS